MSEAENTLTIKTGTRVRFRTQIYQSDGATVFNLTGFTFRCEARAQKSKSSALLATFAGSLVGPATAGIIQWELGKTASGALTVTPMFFDVEIQEVADPDNVERPIQGMMTLDFETTD